MRDAAIAIWFGFFWRYAIFFALFLLCGGLLLNLLQKTGANPAGLLVFNMSYSLAMNALAVFLGLLLCLRRRKGNTPAGKALWGLWWGFLWRFFLFSIAIAFIATVLFAQLLAVLDCDPIQAIKYSPYIGFGATIPASLLVFLLLFWRKRTVRELFDRNTPAGETV